MGRVTKNNVQNNERLLKACKKSNSLQAFNSRFYKERALNLLKIKQIKKTVYKNEKNTDY